jgi:hypothetical protein
MLNRNEIFPASTPQGGAGDGKVTLRVVSVRGSCSLKVIIVETNNDTPPTSKYLS